MPAFFCKIGQRLAAAPARCWFVNSIKLAGALAIIAFYFAYAVEHASFVTVSPDSVRFMHFWQTAADQFRHDGGGAKHALQAVFSAVDASNKYDVHRGRFLQCAAYAIDGLTRGSLPFSGLNLWMMLLLTLNAGLIAWVAASVVLDPPRRMSLFCLGAVTIATTVLSVSPIMLLNLYAKYLWLPFVLIFYVSRKPLSRVGCLAAAAFTDELGLFAALILTGMSVVRYLLAHPSVDPWSYPAPMLRVLGACVWGALAALAVLFMFFGVSAVVLNVGAEGFRIFVYGNTREVVQGGVLSGAIHDVLWRAELLVFGTLLGSRALMLVVGPAVLGVVVLGFWRRWRTVVLPSTRGLFRWDERMRDWLDDKRGHFYSFWIAMLLLIVVLVLPRRGEDLTHYCYPAAAILGLLFLAGLVDLLPGRVVALVLSTILVVHVCLALHAVELTSRRLGDYLMPDHTVTAVDLQAINQSVRELQATGTSAAFAACNNGQEIEFAGHWFYTRIGIQERKGYSSPYFPVQGTVRVLLWPHPLGANVK